MFPTKDHNTVKSSFTHLKENQHIKGMSCAYPNYENTFEFVLPSPWILLTKYGIPKLTKFLFM